MKSPRHTAKPRAYSALVQPGGRIALPPDLSIYRLGQRQLSAFADEFQDNDDPVPEVFARVSVVHGAY